MLRCQREKAPRVRVRVRLIGVRCTDLPGLGNRILRSNERGFTLPEVLTVIAILGILIAIAVIILLGILERRRVDAATKQFVSDLRLAHTSATNQLTDWRVVFMPDGTSVTGCSGVDYCMVKLAAPYTAGAPTPALDPATPLTPRELPQGTQIWSVTFCADCAGGGAGAIVSPSSCAATRTLEFSSDGTARTLRPGLSGTVRISSTDGDPFRDVRFDAATSRIRILP